MFDVDGTIQMDFEFMDKVEAHGFFFSWDMMMNFINYFSKFKMMKESSCMHVVLVWGDILDGFDW